MGKFVFAFILIANLLICPFRCLSSEWGTVSEGGAAPSACSCCQPDNNCDDSPPKDEGKHNDSSCPNCICEGATLQAGPKVSAIDVQYAMAHWLIPADVATQCEMNSYPARLSDRTPRFAGGHTARIAFQVWLI